MKSESSQPPAVAAPSEPSASTAPPAPSEPPHTAASLASDLRRLGVVAGDVLFVHSSYKSVGPVEGGAQAIVDAFMDVLGPTGTLLMPSFNLVKAEDRTTTWNIDTTPATTGYLTDFFRLMPGTVRSDHFSHSVAARGHRARWYTRGHLSREGMKSPWDQGPWGAAYGVNSPMLRAYDAGGKLLKLGTDYHTSTYLHLVEVRYWDHQLRTNSDASYFYANRPLIGERYDREGQLTRNLVGNADSRLIPIQPYVETCVRWVTEEPATYFKWYS